MANWTGKAGKGAMRTLRASKREEAEARQASFTAEVKKARRADPTLTEAVARQVVAQARRTAREQ